MLSWDDYDNNTEETAVVNEAALQQLKTAEQPAPAAPVVEAAPAPVSPESAPAAPAAPVLPHPKKLPHQRQRRHWTRYSKAARTASALPLTKKP